MCINGVSRNTVKLSVKDLERRRPRRPVLVPVFAFHARFRKRFCIASTYAKF